MSTADQRAGRRPSRREGNGDAVPWVTRAALTASPAMRSALQEAVWRTPGQRRRPAPSTSPRRLSA